MVGWAERARGVALELPVVLHNAGAAVTAGLGLVALVRPSAAASLTSLSPKGLVGVSELRATYGGFFLALGAVALAWQSGAVFQAAGAAWLGAAGGRAVSLVVDRSSSFQNLGAVAFETAIGAILLV